MLGLNKFQPSAVVSVKYFLGYLHYEVVVNEVVSVGVRSVLKDLVRVLDLRPWRHLHGLRRRQVSLGTGVQGGGPLHKVRRKQVLILLVGLLNFLALHQQVEAVFVARQQFPLARVVYGWFRPVFEHVLLRHRLERPIDLLLVGILNL